MYKNLQLDVQRCGDLTNTPDDDLLHGWASKLLAALVPERPISLSVRIVDDIEMQSLNRAYRQISSSTNVLSFPCGQVDEHHRELLGDIVLCQPQITREAAEQGKSIEHHWAHIIMHGVLHLLGYDHLQPEPAEIMENIEIEHLAGLGIANPYQETVDSGTNYE